MTDSNATDLTKLLPFALALLDDRSSFTGLKQQLEGYLKGDPTDVLLTTLVGGGLAYYLAEREHNPDCKTPLDGILYLAMSDNDQSPQTETGKAIATFVRTFVPTLAGEVIDKHSADERRAVGEAARINRAMLERLDRIVELLEKQPR